MLFGPVSPTGFVSKLGNYQLSLLLEASVPGHIKEAHVNAPNNVIVVDAVNAAALNQLLSTTFFHTDLLDLPPWIIYIYEIHLLW